MELLPRDGRKSHAINRIVYTPEEGMPSAYKIGYRTRISHI